ncbi:hypothetical protein ACLOAV_001779 [Pseudogymnoascus australis]
MAGNLKGQKIPTEGDSSRQQPDPNSIQMQQTLDGELPPAYEPSPSMAPVPLQPPFQQPQQAHLQQSQFAQPQQQYFIQLPDGTMQAVPVQQGYGQPMPQQPIVLMPVKDQPTIVVNNTPSASAAAAGGGGGGGGGGGRGVNDRIDSCVAGFCGGFFIPTPKDLTDIDSLLGYLYTLISVFHECLLCGSLKPTRLAVQDHMCGKGHCRLDFSNDRHKFWQFYDTEGTQDELPGANLVPDDDELHLPSGKTVGSRSGARSSHRNSNRRRSSSAPSLHRRLLNEGEPEAMPPTSLDRRLITRAGTSTSMVGIPEVQRLALVAVERQMFAMEMRGMNERQSRVDKGGNRQKRYKVPSYGKKQGGLEKRLG